MAVRSVSVSAVALLSILASPSPSLAKGTVAVSIDRRTTHGGNTVPGRRVYKRAIANTVESVVYGVWPWSTGGAYYTNVTVGTPPQTLTVILDTGSSDLYVDASHARACQDKQAADGCRGGAFDTSASTTYNVVQANAFNASFGDGSTAGGDFATDVLGIGSVVLSGVQLGVATDVKSTTGYAVSLVGIGYPQNEAAAEPYPNVPDLLKSSGAINSRLYSIFLNNQDDKSGSILFGGIDTSKYKGTLHTMNLLPAPYTDPKTNVQTNLVYQFIVPVTGLVVNAPGGSNTVLANGDATGTDTSRFLPALLDTGSASWTVPPSWYRAIAAAFGANEVDSDGFVKCSHESDKISLDIVFGGKVTINVPVATLLTPLYDPKTNKQVLAKDGSGICVLGVTPDAGGKELGEVGYLTLGDSVLREMYVVFDMDNGQASIAQASFDTAPDPSGSSVKVVKAGESGLKDAVAGANGGVSTDAANTGTLAATLTVSESITLLTATSAVGTATGTDAVPVEGRVSATASSAGADSTGSTGTHQGAASAHSLPALNMAAPFIAAIWLGMCSLGMAIVL